MEDRAEMQKAINDGNNYVPAQKIKQLSNKLVETDPVTSWTLRIKPLIKTAIGECKEIIRSEIGAG